MSWKTIVLIGGLILFLGISLTNGLKFKIPNENKEKGKDYWYALAKEDLQFALNRKIVNNVAKNIILFLGDGMGITVETAGRIFKGQKKGVSGEEEFLVWEKFPNTGFSKTYNVDKQVPDSAATATAFFSGVKANFYTVGVSAAVVKGDCKGSLVDENRVETVLKWAQDSGKDTGIVTTTRITHATPSALYAHSAHRYWECNTEMDNQTEYNVDGCKDIARQLVEDEPGKNVNVILAGGRRQMGASLPGDTGGCLRSDNQNLVEKWLAQKKESGFTAKYVTNNEGMKQINPESDDYILGLFAGAHLPYSYERKGGPDGTPSLKELTRLAIKRLKRNSKGFFLMVEGGRIDHALHDTRPHPTLQELLDMEEAVDEALKMTNTEDTLIIVTADHSHVMTMNGYPERGNDILGTSTYEDVTDGMPHTTLMFTNGVGANFTWDGKKVVRANLTGVDTRDYDFKAQSAVPTKLGYETHGGEDVGIYASGPMSYLFHRVHEQSYIAHVMGYSACIGPYTKKCDRPDVYPSATLGTAPVYSGSNGHFTIKWSFISFLVSLVLGFLEIM